MSRQRKRATGFVVVPPMNCGHVTGKVLADIESALTAALPKFEFQVTTDHPARQMDDFFVEPNGQIRNMGAVAETLAMALARFAEPAQNFTVH